MNNKKVLVSLLIVIIAIGGYFSYNKFLTEKTVKGNKEITVTVINKDENYEKEHIHRTDAEKLGVALDEMGIAETSKGDFGRMVTKVDGINTEMAKQQWWNIAINGEDAQTGIDDTVIKDGDKIEFIYKVGF